MLPVEHPWDRPSPFFNIKWGWIIIGVMGFMTFAVILL